MFIVGVFLFVSCGKNVIRSEADIAVWYWMPEKQKTFENLAKKYLQGTGIRVVFKNIIQKMFAETKYCWIKLLTNSRKLLIFWQIREKLFHSYKRVMLLTFLKI
jgi:hypothetical protein